MVTESFVLYEGNMLKVNLICIGKLKEKYLKDACEEYSKRLSAFCNLNIIELSEYKLSDEPSNAMILKSLESEGKGILSKISDRSFTVSMCIEGKQLDSVQLSQYIDEKCSLGISEINFVIGGSFGLSNEVKAASSLKLSMSKMTFPHQLARVMLLEQIYRGFMISKGGKYHK